MFEVLIREAGARFGLGDKALPLLQMLLASMTRKETGGLAGFLEQFKAAGLGPVVQSWLGGGPAAQPLSSEQVTAALGGASGGLLSQIASRLNVGTDAVSAGLGYLLPPVVGLLTPGGSLPTHLPAEVTALAATGEGLLAAPAAGAAGAGAEAGGFMKWLPWVAAALAAVLGLAYCSKDRGATPAPSTPPAQTAPATTGGEAPPAATPGSDAASAAESATESATAPASAEATGSTATGTEGNSTEGNNAAPADSSAPATDAAPAAADTPAATGNTSNTSSTEAAPAADSASTAPTVGASVEALTVQDKPALKVFFDSGKTEVHADFAAKAADLLAWLQAHEGGQAVISGFNDPTGNAAANAELSRQRAQAVQSALIALGVPAERTVLEKPAEATDTSAASLAESRRVEVMVRD